MARRSRVLSPTNLTLTLAALLGGVAVLIGLRAGSGPIVDLDLPAPVVVGALTLLFFAAEFVLLNVEFRRQAHSLTLAGVPLALTVFLAPAHTAILIRVVGALAALLLQRISWQKLVFNIASYAFEIGVSCALVRLLVVSGQPLGQGSFVIVLVVVVAVDQVMSVLVLGVISLHGGPMTRAERVDVLAPSLALSLVTTAFATASVVLIERAGALGVELVALVSAVAFAAYRGYASTRRRHQSLELMHTFVADGVGAESVTVLTEQLLMRIRTLMNAATAELRIFESGSGPHDRPSSRDSVEGPDIALRMIVSDTEQLEVVREDSDPTDWLTLRVRTENEPELLARDSKDRAVRAWLKARSLRDAVIVPLPVSHALAGIVVVSDRLGETATFTADDVSLLETLTGHLAVALRSTQLVEKLSYDASHDSLTGLYNRSYLTDAIRRTVIDRQDPGAGVAVLLLDLDNFKDVNDTLGHDAGDRLLQVVSGRLRSRTPAGATVARLGGDEFAVLLPSLRGGRAQALEIAEQLAHSLSQPVHLDEARLDIQQSIGVAFSDGSHLTDDLLRQADTAMYAAKTARVAVSVYNADMDRVRTERLDLLADLRNSVRTDPGQFVLHYQPKVDLHTDTVTGTEALVRWQHPRLGLVNPDLFIPLAEATGLIDELTRVVLDAAVAQCADWTAAGHRLSVAVNLSARNIENPQLPKLVSDTLRVHGVHPAQLILEITESIAMGDPKVTMPVLHQLNDLGVSLSLDDFGTGHSSLAYLQQLPVTEVKIDRSFVLGLTAADPTNSRALIRGIASLSKNLGLRVVAEGVEDKERLNELRDLGCDIAQGYYISKPMAAADLHAWLINRSTNPASPRLRLLKATT